MLLAFYQSYANSAGSFSISPRRTWISWSTSRCKNFSLLLARFRTYASSYASFANSPAGFYQIRTWMLWKLPGTRLFRVGWKKHLACLCFSTLNKKFEVKFERISLPQRGSEPGTPSLWVRCANHYTTDPFVIWRQKLVDYILQCRFWIKMG